MLTFDHDTHRYFWEGAPVPNVTSLLNLLTDFSSVPPHVLEAAQERGTMVHLICELHDRGELDAAAIPGELRGYYDAYLKFLGKYPCMWLGVEEKVYHPLLRYAGTADRRGYVEGQRAVLDIKTSEQLYDSVGPQLSAYLEAYRARGVLPKTGDIERHSLRLGAGGDFKLDVFPKASHKTHWAVFTACLTINNYRSK